MPPPPPKRVDSLAKATKPPPPPTRVSSNPPAASSPSSGPTAPPPTALAPRAAPTIVAIVPGVGGSLGFAMAASKVPGQAGVRVSGIKPNSTSDKAGLRVGDVILEVNEVCLISSTHAAVKDAVKVASAGGGAVRIKVCSRAHADRVVADAAAAPVPVPVHPQPAGKGVAGTSDVASLTTGLKPLGGEAVIDTVAAIDGGGGGGGGAATEPCTSYKLDMAAAIFGMCKCGFPKQKHATTQAPPGKSKPPAARPYGLSMPAQAPAPEAAAMSNVPKPAPISRTSSNEALPVLTSSLLSPTSPSTSPTRSHARPKPRPRSMFVLPTEVSVEPRSASSPPPPTSPHFSTPAPVTRLLAASAAPMHTPPPPPPPQPSEEAGTIARTHTPPHPPPSPPLPTAVAPGGFVAAASASSAHTDADTPGPPGPAPEMLMASQKNTVQTSSSSITTTALTTTGSISTSTSTSSEAVGLKLRIVELEALVRAANAKAEGAALETSGVVQKLAESTKAAEAAEARALNAEAGKSQTEALLAEAASTESNQAAELRAKLAALQSDLSVATAAAHQHTAGFTKAKASLEVVNAEKEKLLAENATLRSRVEQLQTDLTEVRNDKEESLELETATAVLQSKLESSARAIASEQERTAVVETEKMALIEQIAQLQTHAETKAAEANRVVSDLTVEISKLKAAVTTAASTAAAKLSAATGAAGVKKKVLEASSAAIGVPFPVPVSTSTPAAIPASTVPASPVKDSTAAAIAAALAAKNNGSSTPAPAPAPAPAPMPPLPPREDAPKPAQSSSSPAKDSTAAAIAAALAAKSNFTTTAGEHATCSTPPPPVVAAPRPRPSAKPKKSAPTIKQRPVTMFEKASPEKADTSAIEPIDGGLHLRPKPGKKVRPMSVMATHGKLGASLEGLLGRGPMPGMGMVRPKSREGSSSDSLGASPPKPKPSARTARPQSMFVTSSSSPIPGARLRPGTGELLAKSPPTGDDVFEGLAVPSASRLDSTAQMDRRSASMSAKTKRRPPSRKMIKKKVRPVSLQSPLKEEIFEDETTGSAEMLPQGKAPSAPAGTKPSLLIVGVDATAAAESSTDGAEEQSAIEALLEDTCDTGEDTGEDTEEKKKKKKGGMHKLKKMRKGLFGKKSSSKEAA